jgi:hypothetical protein
MRAHRFIGARGVTFGDRLDDGVMLLDRVQVLLE